MGWGDDLMTTGIVKRAYARVGRPLCVGDGRIRWSPLFDGNPKIAKRAEHGALWVRSFEGRRPYIDYANSTPEHYAWNREFRAEPGEIYLTRDELAPYARLAGYVYIEPNCKGEITANKDWGFDLWQTVVAKLPEVRFVQGQGRRLVGVEQVDTPSFRHACAALALCDGFVGTDGGLHHAAAALEKRAVIVWGGYAPPASLGYQTHVNLCAATRWCGSRAPCEHCRKALDAISVEKVVEAIRKMVTYP